MKRSKRRAVREAKGAAQPGVVDLEASARAAKAEDDRLAERAYKLADAWARSVPGTPYGVEEPVTRRPE